MGCDVSTWVELIAFLSQRRDDLTAALNREKDQNEKLRLEGAMRELNWLTEQLEEQWGRWASRQPRDGK